MFVAPLRPILFEYLTLPSTLRRSVMWHTLLMKGALRWLPTSSSLNLNKDLGRIVAWESVRTVVLLLCGSLEHLGSHSASGTVAFSETQICGLGMELLELFYKYCDVLPVIEGATLFGVILVALLQLNIYFVWSFQYFWRE